MTPLLLRGRAGRIDPISYAVSGPTSASSGESPVGRDLVLVHGWCCDRSLMAPLQAHLEHSHRVLTLDLRGHGQSRDPQDDGSTGAGGWRADQELGAPTGTVATSVAEFADDVVAVCAEARLRDPVVIGHSLGALIALETLRADSRRQEVTRPPWQPAGAVLLDPAPVARQKSKAAWADRVGPVSRDHTGDLRRELARSLVLPTDQADYGPVTELMAITHPQVAAGGAQAMATYDGAHALEQLAAPALIIQAASAERGLDQLVPDRRWLTMGRTVGAGHFHQLEVPEQLLAMITRWLQITTFDPA